MKRMEILVNGETKKTLQTVAFCRGVSVSALMRLILADALPSWCESTVQNGYAYPEFRAFLQKQMQMKEQEKK